MWVISVFTEIPSWYFSMASVLLFFMCLHNLIFLTPMPLPWQEVFLSRLNHDKSVLIPMDHAVSGDHMGVLGLCTALLILVVCAVP